MRKEETATQRKESRGRLTSYCRLSHVPSCGSKTNYARIWNEKNEAIFAARGGTYSLEGDKIHQKPTIALATYIIGVDLVLKVTRLDKSTMIAQIEFPPVPNPTNPTHTRELTFRRIE